MRQLVRVSADLLREARARKSILGLFIGVTLVLVVLGGFLRLDVVDGAIAGSKLFGAVLFSDIRQADVALRPIFMTVAYLAFYGGSLFLAVACSDFAPNLLSPGRIEHLLSLPVSRWQLLFGTYLGVVTMAFATAAYGAVGVTVLFGVKTGVWTWRLLGGATLGMVGFCAVYAAMTCLALFVRSAAAGAALGVGVVVLGVVSSQREAIIGWTDPGLGRFLFSWAIRPVPRLGDLATAGARLAGEMPIELAAVLKLSVGALVFSLALLAVAAWRFERRDF